MMVMMIIIIIILTGIMIRMMFIENQLVPRVECIGRYVIFNAVEQKNDMKFYFRLVITIYGN